MSSGDESLAYHELRVSLHGHLSQENVEGDSAIYELAESATTEYRMKQGPRSSHHSERVYPRNMRKMQQTHHMFSDSRLYPV